jgi:hypothetical protein
MRGRGSLHEAERKWRSASCQAVAAGMLSFGPFVGVAKVPIFCRERAVNPFAAKHAA